jgi:protease-4
MNKRWGCVGVILLVLLCFSGLLNLLLLVASVRKNSSASATSRSLPQFGEELVQEGNGGSSDKIALITMRGIISSSINGTVGESMVDDMKIALQQAVDDSKVKAIVLNIDSPGGEVTASDVIYNAVVKARAKKPVVIYMGSLTASGGYYVSCGGSYLMANDTTLTGSIGVIIETMNYASLLGKIGVSPEVFKSGKFKDMLSGSREMTQDEKDYIQNMVMQTYGKFVQIVADERKLPVDQLRNGIADGRVISGKDALDDKLIDGLGQIEDAFDKARELGKAPGASVVRYKATFALGNLFKMLGESNQSSQTKVEVNLTQKMLPPLEPGKLYMLPSFYAQ